GRVLLSQTESPLRIGAVSLLASIQFFIVTNFGAWVTDIHSASPTYTSDWNGLFKCYELGIAFYRTEAWPLGFFGNTVLSDLFFTAVLFGAHACLSRTAFPAERIKAAENVALSHG